jgi:hypothetical protein
MRLVLSLTLLALTLLLWSDVALAAATTGGPV